jgi:hypothetical protein
LYEASSQTHVKCFFIPYQLTWIKGAIAIIGSFELINFTLHDWKANEILNRHFLQPSVTTLCLEKVIAPGSVIPDRFCGKR